MHLHTALLCHAMQGRGTLLLEPVRLLLRVNLLLHCMQDIGVIARRTLRRLPKKTRLKFLASKRRSELGRQPSGSSSTQVVQGGNGDAPLSVQSSKPIVLVLGSGWAAHSLIKVQCQTGALHACMHACTF